MDQSSIAVRYAKALFELAVEQNMEESVFVDIQFIKNLLNKEESFTRILSSKAIDVFEKQDICARLLSNQINPLTNRFLAYLIQKRREDYLLRIVLEYIRHFNRRKNLINVVIKSAVPLSQNHIESIENAIQTQLQKTPSVEAVIDDSLIGGYQIIVGDRFYDYSVKGMLEKFGQSI